MSTVISFILKFLEEIIIFVIAYLLGNISPAMIISKIRKVDIRKEGSGNPGTTNVIRVLGLKDGLYTLLIDMLKAFIAVRIGFSFLGSVGGMTAFAAVLLGRCFPVFYKFKGGKGVAAAFGAGLALTWPAAFAAFIIACIVLGITKKMSLGSIVAAIVFPPLVLFYTPEYFIFSIFVGVFLVIRHIPNIKRLKNAEEETLDIAAKIREMK